MFYIFYITLGEIDNALKYLERASVEEPWPPIFLVNDPFLMMRSDPRFVAVLKKTGLHQ